MTTTTAQPIIATADALTAGTIVRIPADTAAHIITPNEWTAENRNVTVTSVHVADNYRHINFRHDGLEMLATVQGTREFHVLRNVRADELQVGDVFTTIDEPNTPPLFLGSVRDYQVTAITPSPTDSCLRQITWVPSDELEGYPHRTFNNAHRVLLVARTVNPAADNHAGPVVTRVPVTDLRVGDRIFTETTIDRCGLGSSDMLNLILTIDDIRVNPDGDGSDKVWFTFTRAGRTIAEREYRWFYHHDGYGSTQTVPVMTPRPEAPPQHVPVLPRTAAEAESAAAALELAAKWTPTLEHHTTAETLRALARWLPGGELNTIGHQHAQQASLCGQYEAVVCPTLGWTPRRGEDNSRMGLTSMFLADLERFEKSHPGSSALELAQLWLRRYDDQGTVNTAVVDHARDHLEEYKWEGVNELLSEVLGWSYLLEKRERCYDVTVEVTRTITVSQTVTLHRTAEDPDDVEFDSYDLMDAIDDNNWQTESGDTVSASTGRYDIDDHDIIDTSECSDC